MRRWHPAEAAATLVGPLRTRDSDIRRVLHESLWTSYADDPDTEIIDELAVCHAGARADVVLVNGHLGGFEIKSDADSLARLTQQSKYFDRVFDRMTLVCAPRHANKALERIPEWWGICVADASCGSVQLCSRRAAGQNPAPSRWARAALLRRDEMVQLLLKHGMCKRTERAPRRVLLPALLENLPPVAVDDEIRRCLRARARAAAV